MIASAANKSVSRPLNRAGIHARISLEEIMYVPVLGDVFVVGLEEHDHFHPVGVNPTPVWHEEVTTSTEVTLDLTF